MPSFLSKTAKYLFEKYNHDFEDIAIVLPNKRAGLFFKDEISKLINKPIWLPEIMGAENFIETLSESEIIENTLQIFELYNSYQKTTKNPEPFEEFTKWGQILLHDFNEIDRYLIPTTDFFKQINDIRALEVWNLGEQPITELQSQYLKFWEQLTQIYNTFQTDLASKNRAYQGMAFRKVADEISKNPSQFIEKKIKWKKVIFVGFNALNKAEETIIATLLKQNKAEILWDADAYYLDDELQESGYFLRQFKQKAVFSPFNWVSDKFNSTKKEIEIIGIPQNIGQAKYLPTLLAKLNNQVDYKNTAVVLADENMLIPVMQSIPTYVKNINITMGYPLKNTSVATFFEIYLTMLVNAERYGNKQQLTYHYTDFIKLLQLSFAEIVFGKAVCKQILALIVKHNWVFINKDKLVEINNLIIIKFTDTLSIETIINTCLAFIDEGKNYYQQQNKKATLEHFNLEIEYLFQFAKLFNLLQLLLKKYPVLFSVKGFYSIYKQMLNNYSIELYGEPLQGLQIMGMLETRNIDFENIILIGTNEGVLPKGKTFNSFIPFDLKKSYQLPTHQEKDAIYAYHFYRLVQNATNITLLYNTETNEYGNGEQSRFITQIEHELANKNNITITKKLINYETVKTNYQAKEIEKTPETINRVKELFLKGLSPSAINCYLACPLDFYYKYVLKIYETDQVEETIERNTFGSNIHKILELLYTDSLNKVLTTNHIEKMLQLLPATTMQVFLEGFSKTELSSGKNLIILSVAENYIKTFLKNELNTIKNTPFPTTIISLENKMEVDFNLALNNEKITVKLKGIADRVDKIADTIRIIDYKTGIVEAKNLSINSIEEFLENTESNKAFQVLFYSYLYYKKNLASLAQQNLQSGIVSFRKLSSNFMAFNLNKEPNITPNVFSDFEIILNTILSEMLDEKIPFTHQTDAEYCKFCLN